MTIGEIIQALTTLAALILAVIALRKSGAEKKKLTAEGLHEDASAAEIYQRVATEAALSKSQTIASMQKQISELTDALSSEQTARRALEATVVELNGDLAEARKELAEERVERATAMAELSNLKAWYERLKVWIVKWQPKMVEAGIEPLPTLDK